jgi:transposase-like protein
MKKVKQLRKRRHFSEVFKRQLVKEFESGHSTVNELSEDYSIQTRVLYRWIHKYSRYYQSGSRIVVEMKSQEQTNKELREQIAKLEQVVGKKQMEIDYLEKLIELSEKAYKVEIKKKADTSPLTGSADIDPNTAGQ